MHLQVCCLGLNPLKVIQSGRLNKVRGASAYNALEGTDADFIVHPNYVTTVKNYFNIQRV